MGNDVIVDYEDYVDLCPDCENHNTCHGDKIDYDSVYACKKELWRIKRLNKNKNVGELYQAYREAYFKAYGEYPPKGDK